MLGCVHVLMDAHIFVPIKKYRFKLKWVFPKKCKTQCQWKCCNLNLIQRGIKVHSDINTTISTIMS